MSVLVRQEHRGDDALLALGLVALFQLLLPLRRRGKFGALAGYPFVRRHGMK